jgi:hypothetical protein
MRAARDPLARLHFADDAPSSRLRAHPACAQPVRVLAPTRRTLESAQASAPLLALAISHAEPARAPSIADRLGDLLDEIRAMETVAQHALRKARADRERKEQRRARIEEEMLRQARTAPIECRLDDGNWRTAITLVVRLNRAAKAIELFAQTVGKPRRAADFLLLTRLHIQARQWPEAGRRAQEGFACEDESSWMHRGHAS